MALMGAGIGALVEWQEDDGQEGDNVTGSGPQAGVWDRELDQEYEQITRNMITEAQPARATLSGRNGSA